MIALMFALCLLSSGFTGNLYKQLSKESTCTAESARMAAVWFVLLGVLFGGATLLEPQADPVLVPVAIGAGVGICLAAFVLIESMKKNAMSVSVIIINLNFIIPVLLSALILKESVEPIQTMGILLSVAVILLLNLKGDGSQKTVGKAMILLPLIACIANGLVNFFIKLHEQHGGSSNLFFCIMYTSAAVTALLIEVVTSEDKQKKTVFRRETLPFMLAMGACNGICFYTTEKIAGVMNAVAQFTIVTSASIVLSLVVGVLFQKERFIWWH